jgi:hypothetical protein
MSSVFEQLLHESLVFWGGVDDEWSGDGPFSLAQAALQKSLISFWSGAQLRHLVGELAKELFGRGVFCAHKLGAGVGAGAAYGRTTLLLQLLFELSEGALALVGDLAFCLGEQLVGLALGLSENLLDLALALGLDLT